jgi:hypothetical protein
MLRHLWSGWRGPLMYVQPDTVVRWQRTISEIVGSAIQNRSGASGDALAITAALMQDKEICQIDTEHLDLMGHV